MKITIAQIDISDKEIEANANKIIHIIKENADSDIILFPELALTGFPTSDNLKQKQTESASFFQNICETTQQHYTQVIIGHIEKSSNVFYNSAFLLSNGQEQIIHRKAHLWINDQGVFRTGDRSTLFSFNKYQIGAQICFDLEFPEGCRSLAKAGADLILMPNGNMHPYENTHYILSQARAIENQVFVVTCNRAGSGYGGQFTGESLVVSPQGDVLLKMNSEETIKTIELDMKNIELSRADYQYITHP